LKGVHKERAAVFSTSLSEIVQEAVEGSGIMNMFVQRKVNFLSDDGSGCLQKPFNEDLRQVRMRDIFDARLHHRGWELRAPEPDN